MAERNYWVLCDDNCRFPAMTKEQILAAIIQAVNEGTVSDIDAGFITKIKEMNARNDLKFWVGTSAEYNALETIDDSTFYILTDDDTGATLDGIVRDIEEIRETYVKKSGDVIDGDLTVRGKINGTAQYADLSYLTDAAICYGTKDSRTGTFSVVGVPYGAYIINCLYNNKYFTCFVCVERVGDSAPDSILAVSTGTPDPNSATVGYITAIAKNCELFQCDIDFMPYGLDFDIISVRKVARAYTAMG